MVDTAPLATAPAAGTALTLHEFLAALKRQGQLRPLLVTTLLEKITLAAARGAGLTVSDSELQQAADDFRRRTGLASSAQTQRWLDRQGLTVEELEAGLEHQVARRKFQDHLVRTRLANTFAAERDRLARARLRQIVVASDGEARELFSQLQDEGRDFADLARRHSLHAASRVRAGELGVVLRLQLPAVVADLVFAAREGAIVGPVATREGVHLFLVEALLPPELDEPTSALLGQEIFGRWTREQLAGLHIDLAALETA